MLNSSEYKTFDEEKQVRGANIVARKEKRMYIEKENELIRRIHEEYQNDAKQHDAEIDLLFDEKDKLNEEINNIRKLFLQRANQKQIEEQEEKAKTAMQKINKMCEKYSVARIFEDIKASGTDFFAMCAEYQRECEDAYREEADIDE